jgi:hypothetical protein
MSYLLSMFWIPVFTGMTILSHAGGSGPLKLAGGGNPEAGNNA